MSQDKKSYDDPDIEAQWCNEQQAVVAAYLQSQNVRHGRIGEWPAWHIAPVVSIWAIESTVRLNWIGWWVISGDLPTDYISSADVSDPQHPRTAIQMIAERWLKQADAWKEDRDFEGIQINSLHTRKELSTMLESRANLIIEWAENDLYWTE